MGLMCFIMQCAKTTEGICMSRYGDRMHSPAFRVCDGHFIVFKDIPCRWRGLNPRPRPYQGRALPLSYNGQPGNDNKFFLIIQYLRIFLFNLSLCMVKQYT